MKTGDRERFGMLRGVRPVNRYRHQLKQGLQRIERSAPVVRPDRDPARGDIQQVALLGQSALVLFDGYLLAAAAMSAGGSRTPARCGRSGNRTNPEKRDCKFQSAWRPGTPPPACPPVRVAESGSGRDKTDPAKRITGSGYSSYSKYGLRLCLKRSTSSLQRASICPASAPSTIIRRT